MFPEWPEWRLLADLDTNKSCRFDTIRDGIRYRISVFRNHSAPECGGTIYLDKLPPVGAGIEITHRDYDTRAEEQAIVTEFKARLISYEVEVAL